MPMTQQEFLADLDKVLGEWESEHEAVTRPDKRPMETVKAWHLQLRSAAIRMRERSLPDPWYEAGEAKDGAKYWLRLAYSAPNFR